MSHPHESDEHGFAVSGESNVGEYSRPGVELGKNPGGTLIRNVLSLVFSRRLSRAFFVVWLSGVTIMMVTSLQNIWRQQTVFVPVTAIVLNKHLDQSFGDSESPGNNYTPILDLQFDYKGMDYNAQIAASGSSKSQSHSEAVLEKIEIGSQYSCWIDPDKPRNVIVERGTFGTTLLFFAFMLGGGLLVFYKWETLPVIR